MTFAYSWHHTLTIHTAFIFGAYGFIADHTCPALVADAHIRYFTCSIYAQGVVTVGDSAVHTRLVVIAYAYIGIPHPTRCAIAHVRNSAKSILYATALTANN